MTVVKGVKNIRREDLSADVPDWIDGVLEPLNTFMDSTIGALRNGVNYRDNTRASLKKFTFTDQVELEVSHSFNGMVGVHVLYCEDYFQLRTRQIDNDTVGITLMFDSSASEEVTFVIIADIKLEG